MNIYRNGKDILYRELEVVEKSVNNKEIWFGAGAVEDSFIGYHLISGNNVFGDPVLLLNVEDTPFREKHTYFDFHKIFILDSSSSNPYYIRFIYGDSTPEIAESKYNYTTTIVGDKKNTDPTILISERILVKTKVWAKCKNETNESTIDVLMGCYGYLE